jgi:DNA-binding IscR family transcriptional regulator
VPTSSLPKWSCSAGIRAVSRPATLPAVQITVGFALQGDAPLFQCGEIRCCGKIGQLSPKPEGPCPVNMAMQRAEASWRETLASQTLADVQADIDRDPGVRTIVRSAFEE